MRKASIKGFFTLLTGFGLILFIASCVDLSVENIPQSIDFNSKVKFVNNVPGIEASISVDGSQIGSVQSGGESAYVDANSGSRNIQANYTSGPNVEQRVVLDAERKIIVTIEEDTTVVGQDTTLVRFFVKNDDGYIWE